MVAPATRWRFLTVPAKLALLVVVLLAGIMVSVTTDTKPASAGVFFNDVEWTYKEYWAAHTTYTGTCDAPVVGDSWFVEPNGCPKTIQLDIPDNVQGAIAAVIYVDLWRNRSTKSARFSINNGPQITPNIGSDFSRDPYSTTVPLTQLRQGANLITFQAAGAPYHVHDVMVRVYYSPTQPLVAGPGSDVTPPTGALTTISAGGKSFAPADGGTLTVDDNQVTLAATASGAAYVEFHGYYDGFDEDNDGITLDWHNFLRNNWAPGGTTPRAAGATIGHIGTDTTSPYQVTWNLPAVKNQSGVKFKVRIVDGAGNVREAAGGISNAFTLARSYLVETYTIPNFVDGPLFFNGNAPQLATRSITLPADLSTVNRAIMLGNYWENPAISLNGNTPFRAFNTGEDSWRTSVRELDVSQLVPGTNQIAYNYVPPGFGVLIEKPGPMIVIHRSAPTGSPAITTDPQNALVKEGRSAVFAATATGAPELTYQWLRNDVPIAGANGASYVTPALTAGDSGSTFKVVVTNPLGSATSKAASVTVLPSGVSSGPWWNTGWDFRVPVVVSPGAQARTDHLAEVLLDFTDLMAGVGIANTTFDPNSVRVVEVDGSGNVIDADIPLQVDQSRNYNAVTNALATVVFVMKGTSAANSVRTYHVYFDKTSKAIPAKVVTPQVTVTDGVVDLGFNAFRFDGAGMSWVFHKDGGGFSKLLDAQGNDWISWNSQTGSLGDFRGVPNAVKPPLGYFHPGRLNSTTSRIVSQGPLKITLESSSLDGSFVSTWDVYPKYATFTMTKAADRFWFLYEGTPGGSVQLGNDVVVTAAGTEVPIDGTFQNDFVGEEWAYVADKALGRSMYFAHHQDDGSVESYRLLDGRMPILGFGRGGNGLNFPYLAPVVNGEPQRFTVGLADSTAYAATAETVRASYQDLMVAIGAADFNGTITGPFSDDFAGLALKPMWTETDPRNDTSVLFTGTEVQLSIPAGLNHDQWTGRNFAPRLLQPSPNADFAVEASFLSTPVPRSGQGLIFQADANNLIRFGVEHNGTTFRTTVTTMTAGTATVRAARNLTSAPGFLRVTRTGSTWRLDRSADGRTWFADATVTFALNVQQAGVFAMTTGSPAPAFVSTVDYFRNRTDARFIDDAPKITNLNITPKARSAVVSWTTSMPTQTTLQHGYTTDVGLRSGNATLKTAHQVTLDYLDCATPYFVQPVAVANGLTTAGTVTSLTTLACPSPVSDDFSVGATASNWTFVDPVGDANLYRNGTNALITIPQGSDHNLYPGANRAARIRQEGPQGDFSVEAKFDSVLNSRFQMQGIVVEDDAKNYLRFEIHHDGTGPKAYVVAVDADTPSVVLTPTAITAASSYRVRVARSGDIWSFSYSTDGTTWTPLSEFNRAVRSTYLSPYIGTTSTNGAVTPWFIGSIDYFFNTAAPIAPEDGGAGADTTAPVISAVAATAATPDANSATVTWTTNELATSRIVWGTTTSMVDGSFIDNGLRTSHSMRLFPLACGSLVYYRVGSTDSSGNATNGTRQSLTMPACPAAPGSDDFSGASLNARWAEIDPAGDGQVSQTGGLLHLAVPAGARHDVSAGNTDALRVMQPVSNADFQVEARFESVVNFRSQMQGLLFEAAGASDLVRFDISHDGTATKAFVGRVKAGVLTSNAYVTVPAAVPSTLRVTKTGTNWLFEYSTDGTTYTTVATVSITSFALARMGPFAGNSNPVVTDVPAHTAVVDYFFNTAAPVVPEDGGGSAGPAFTLFGPSTMDVGTPGVPQGDVNVLGRVTDPDGVALLTYQLNGGAPIAMGMGPDDRRLQRLGDFNATIPIGSLSVGANTVTLRAVDFAGNVTTTDVQVNLTVGQAWPLPYAIDWTTVTNPYSVAKPVDGRWTVVGDTVRVAEPGYDRLLAIGDLLWGTHEVVVPVTINAVDFAGVGPNSGLPGVGFLTHWSGHSTMDNTQPRWGFVDQFGALAWYRYTDPLSGKFELRGQDAAIAAENLSSPQLVVGTTYTFKLRAETGPGVGPRYRLKAWPAGGVEPAGWDIDIVMPVGSKDHGSLNLIAHHVDASFGTVRVTESPQADNPVITPSTGSFPGLVKVSMATPMLGGEIRYTTDGTTPTVTSPLYTAPFFLYSTSTVKARTFATGYTPSAEVSAPLTITAAPARITTGLQALYTFQEGTGTVVRDRSAVTPAADLVIESGSTAWPGNGALRVNTPSVIRTAGAAGKVNNAIMASGAYTFEAWVDPANLTQNPASIVTLAPTTVGTARNASLTQAGGSWQSFLRTSTGTSSGGPLLAAPGAASVNLHHVAVTRTSAGAVRIYVDGVSVATGTRGGTLANWVNTYRLSVAGMVNGSEAWLGDLHLVAVYSSALTGAQVLQNFRAGPFVSTLADRPATTATTASVSTTSTSATSTSSTTTATTSTTTSGSADGTTVVSSTSTAPVAVDRTKDGLLALYDFAEGSGSTVADSAGSASPIDLTVADPRAVTWVKGGLRFDRPTVAASGDATRLTSAIATSGAVTMEAWITPSSLTDPPVATIADLGGLSGRIASLLRGGDRYVAWLRTSASDTSGNTAAVAAGAAPTRQHVVYTRSADGKAAVYLDGVLVETATAAGTLTDWAPAGRLFLGGGADGTKAWSGTLHLVALYGRALAPAEVLRNYRAGDA